MAGPLLHCIEFSMHTHPAGQTPLVLPLGQRGDVEVEVFDHARNPFGTDFHDRFGATGLDAGFRVEIRFHIKRVRVVALKLIHMATPPTVEALGRGGVVDSATLDPDQGVPQLVTLSGGRSAISEVVITAPANETALIEVCIG
jgi:hypothetical protein